MANITINMQNLKHLINTFCSLDSKRQNNVMAYVVRQMMEQRAEEGLIKEKKNVTDEEIQKKTYDRLKTMKDLTDFLDKSDDTVKAAFLLALERISPGVMTKEETVTVNINEKRVPIDQMVKEWVPNTDVSEAQIEAQKWIEHLGKK